MREAETHVPVRGALRSSAVVTMSGILAAPSFSAIRCAGTAILPCKARANRIPTLLCEPG